MKRCEANEEEMKEKKDRMIRRADKEQANEKQRNKEVKQKESVKTKLDESERWLKYEG